MTKNGETISDLDLRGCIDVEADNITIRDTKVSCSRPTTAIRLWDGHRGLVVEDSEIDGMGKVSVAVGFSNYTLNRVNIHDVSDGPRASTNVLIENSYIHDLSRLAGSHNDTIQTTGGTGITIKNNTLLPYKASTNDPMNAALMIGSTTAPAVRDLIFEHNYVDGGNYTVLCRADLVASGVVITDNVFGRHYRYGPIRGAHGVTVNKVSNIWSDTGQAVLN